MVFLVLAAQHGLERGAVLVQRNVGDEAQAALVDADQRHAVARELPADAQHGAVAAHHQAQVALRADGRNVQGGVPCDAGSWRPCRARRPLRSPGSPGSGRCPPARHGWSRRADPETAAWYLPIRATWRNWDFIRQITSLKSRKSLPIMLDDRAKLLLKALVERYIAEGQPVGSRTLSRASGLELSPATIRNVMSDLEDLGLIASPHTSAGRIPTARGYRLFVDTMLTAQREQIARAQPGAGPAAESHRQRGAPAVQPVAVRRRGDGAAPHVGVPPHRIPAPVGAPLPGHHRLARRRRAEPRGLHRGRLHPDAS